MEEVSDLIPKLTASVQIIMNPATNPGDRLQAHQMIEQFRETSQLCIPCGLALAQTGVSPVMRHFGLQLLEHGIKFQWNSFKDEEKEVLKSQSLDLIANGSVGVLAEECYIKDAISRVLVEVIKHEWPTKWKTLLGDLYKLSEKGLNQTELVLKVFLRLVEDVLTFQNVSPIRRKEIMSAMNANTIELFDWFISLLLGHTTKAQALLQEDMLASQGHVKVSAAVLETLTGFADTLNITPVLEKDNTFLEILCSLLGNSALQLPAAECLLVLLQKRGRPEERKPLMILFSEGAMNMIWNAAVAAEAASKDEHFYLFLKRLCQVITELGKTLHTLWGSSVNVSVPPNFEKFLEALLAFTQHPSQMLSNLTQSVWTSYIRHELISVDPIFMKFIPRLISTTKKSLLKVGYPSQSNSLSCEYARIDFDCDEEFTLFFSKYRSEILDTMRQATLKFPTMTFTFGSQWLQSVLEKPLNLGVELEESKGYCNLSSPSFLEWDALSVYLEAVMSKLTLTSEHSPEAIEGISLLKAVLSYKTQDPLILSSQLSCLSALFIFLKFIPDILLDILQKIFSAVVFELPGQTKGTRSKAVKNVRQHACSGLVKMCTKYHELIFPVFDQLYEHIKTISIDPDQLSQMEKCILTEALILISNHFNNYEKEAAFIGEVMKPVKELWLSEEFNQAFWNPEKYMSYIGLDQSAVEPSSADTCGINRSHITYCINLILAVMKRSVWPDDNEKAEKGGFVITKQENGIFMMRNPATCHISILLENALALLKTMNMLWHEDYLKVRHSDFEKAFDLQEKEKQAILGIPHAVTDNTSVWKSKKPTERMQNFLLSSHEMSCHILGNAGMCLGGEFYTIPNLANSINQTILYGLDQIPEYRLRPIIRIKPYIQNCPKEHYATAVLPILAHLCPYMYQRLGARWLLINQKYPQGQEVDDGNPESEEVFQEQMTRLITKEYMELLSYILLGKKQEAVEDKMEEGEGGAQQHPPQQQQELTLGELGILCLSVESVFEPIVLNLFSGLTWNDTVVCLKCTRLAGPMLKQLVKQGKMTPPAANEFFTSIIMGLQMHGQHDLSQPLLLALGVLAYDLLRPGFSAIPQLMLQIPSCSEKSLTQYEERYLGTIKAQKGFEKKKKDAFRKLVESAIAVNVSEQFQRKATYRPVGMLFRQKKKLLVTEDSKDFGLCSLFKPDNNSDDAADSQPLSVTSLQWNKLSDQNEDYK